MELINGNGGRNEGATVGNEEVLGTPGAQINYSFISLSLVSKAKWYLVIIRKKKCIYLTPGAHVVRPSDRQIVTF